MPITVMACVWPQVHVASRGSTQRLLLHDCSVEVAGGEVALVTGGWGAGGLRR